MTISPKMDRAAHCLWWQIEHEPMMAAAWMIWLSLLAKRGWAELPEGTHALRLPCQRLLAAGMIERWGGGVRISAVGERLLLLLESQGRLSRLKEDCLPAWLQTLPPPPAKPSGNAA